MLYSEDEGDTLLGNVSKYQSARRSTGGGLNRIIAVLRTSSCGGRCFDVREKIGHR